MYQNAIKHANYPMRGKEKTFYRNVSFECNILQTTKNRGSHTIWENKTTKKGLISVFSKLITYQNFKTHAKHRSCTNIILLPKKSILRTFELVTLKNAKMESALYRETKRHYENRFFFFMDVYTFL